MVDTEISADTDPHLADHVFRGEPLFAAVLGLEAMAQAAMALAGRRALPVFENVELLRPVVVPPDRSTTLRIAALVREPGRVELVLRDAATGFADRSLPGRLPFRGTPSGASATSQRRTAGTPPSRLPVRTRRPLRRHALPRGRFQRAARATATSRPPSAWPRSRRTARRVGSAPGCPTGSCSAIPEPAMPPSTASRPASRTRPCCPPGSTASSPAASLASEPLTLAARERLPGAATTSSTTWRSSDADGTVRERWEGLRLRAVDRIAPPPAWSAALLGPYVERRLQELLPGPG